MLTHAFVPWAFPAGLLGAPPQKKPKQLMALPLNLSLLQGFLQQTVERDELVGSEALK